jgi:aryl-alcohol dehydrogenase-like predicted oxidoreductase
VIDIYQVHWPDEVAAFEQTAKSLDAFRREGKIRAIGVSNFSPEQIGRFRKFAPLATIQPPTICSSARSKRTCYLTPRSTGLVLAYGALCRGLLTGKITGKTEFKGDDLRKVDPKFQQPRLGHYLEAVVRLDSLARERYGNRCSRSPFAGCSIGQRIVALWGARRPEQLAPVNEVTGWKLDANAMQEIDQILAETIKDEVGPEFMAPPSARAHQTNGESSTSPS